MTLISKSKYALSAATCCALFLGSCDNVEENDRFIPVERPKVERKILIQEFTGIRCINCPNAAKAMHDFQQTEDGKSAVVVAIHPDNTDFSRPIAGFSLSTATGGEYFLYYSGNELPAAIINSGSLNTVLGEWVGKAMSELAKPAVLTMDVTTDYDETSRKLTANYKVTFNEVVESDLSVLVWITESGIIGTQLMPDGSRNKEYEFNHVLRASLNGTWGTNIGKSFTTGQVVDGTAEIQIPEEWNPENCEVVAFAFQTGSKAVENVETAHVIAHTQN